MERPLSALDRSERSDRSDRSVVRIVRSFESFGRSNGATDERDERSERPERPERLAVEPQRDGNRRVSLALDVGGIPVDGHIERDAVAHVQANAR